MTDSASKLLATRLRKDGVEFAANANIGDHVDGSDLAWIEDDVAKACADLLDALCIDRENDHNTRDTATRMAKLFMREVFVGRYTKQPDVTMFPNAKNLDEIFTLGPISMRSMCSHHFAPIIGNVWVGMVPGKKLIGISKVARLVHWVMSRPQIQEEAAVQLADLLERIVEPRGLAVVVKATHFCMTWRGVKEHDTEMATSVMRGLFREAQGCRSEFFSIIAAQGFRS